MRNRVAWLTLLLAVVVWPAVTTPPAGGVMVEQRSVFEVRVPDAWTSAPRLMLVVKDLSVPKNRPVILEFFATADGKKSELLGSYGIVAESDEAIGVWHFETVRVNVTRPLRRWLEGHAATTVSIRVDVVDGDRQPVHGLRWTARSMAIETPSTP